MGSSPVNRMEVPAQWAAATPAARKGRGSRPTATASLTLANGEVGWLQKGSTKYELAGVPAGTYDLYVRFDGKPTHAATVQVKPGQRLTATCNARFRRCSVK